MPHQGKHLIFLRGKKGNLRRKGQEHLILFANEDGDQGKGGSDIKGLFPREQAHGMEERRNALEKWKKKIEHIPCPKCLKIKKGGGPYSTLNSIGEITPGVTKKEESVCVEGSTERKAVLILSIAKGFSNPGEGRGG